MANPKKIEIEIERIARIAREKLERARAREKLEVVREIERILRENQEKQ